MEADAERVLDSYHRYAELWRQQSRLKRETICAILTERVKSYARRLEGAVEEEEAEEDPHKDDLSTLEAYQHFLPPHLRDRLQEHNSHAQEIDPALLLYDQAEPQGDMRTVCTQYNE